ncbi:MAG: putative nucleotidyltransferase with HDIG domain [Paraglaciecola sp.]|jgi:putative nucleotidyltransferase with HDIG domain
MWKILENTDWKNIEATFDWVQDMQNVPQDAIFHAEGDVLTHTRMVVEELMQLSEYQELDEQDKQVLFAAALLHDVEKRSTTVYEPDGRITSRNHARKGEHTVRTILYKEIPTPFYIREAVAKLVRYHGLPLWIFEKSNPQKALLQCSLEVNTEHLAILTTADILGRICPDKAEMLYKIELFKAFCKEQNCYGQKRSFKSDLARFTYFQKEESSPDYVPFEIEKNEVVILCALPGSGKDFYIQKNFNNWATVSLDDIRRQLKILPTDKKGNGRVVQTAIENAKILLRKKESFVWNATNLTKLMRKKIVDLGTQYGAKTRIIYLEVPYQKLKQQNRNREQIVPEKVLERMISRLEMPSIAEAEKVAYLF